MLQSLSRTVLIQIMLLYSCVCSLSAAHCQSGTTCQQTDQIMTPWHAMQARQEIAEVTAAAQEAAGKGQHAQHQSNSSAALTAVREQARDVLAALRSLSKLILRTSAAMQAAANSLQAASCAPSRQVAVGKPHPHLAVPL